MKQTGGKWDPQARGMHFLASEPGILRHALKTSRAMLVSVNSLKSPKDRSVIDEMLAEDIHILIDSGVYNLAMTHASKHNLSHDEALRIPLDKLDGFAELKKLYLDVVQQHGERCWGYIELDLGGRDQKRKTRAELEALGLRPIPVYHPLNDGWDYFDELATEYDRICCGNLVQASDYVRVRIMATLYERKKKYPSLWIHQLGVSPCEWHMAYPVDSCDASSWLSAVRWSGYRPKAAFAPVGAMDKNFQYPLGEGEAYPNAVAMAAMGTTLEASTLPAHYANISHLLHIQV